MKKMNKLYYKTVSFAIECHKNQFRKDGETLFVTHPIRVAQALIDYEFGGIFAFVGLLHDVIEDSKDDLIREKVILFIDENVNYQERDDIICAIDAITIRPNEKKISYYRRVAENEVASYVKIFDRIDNLNDMDGVYDYDKKIEYCLDSLKLYNIIVRYGHVETKFRNEFYREITSKLNDVIYNDIR